MARRILSPPITYWKIFKQKYLELFSISLFELANTKTISGDEDAISERLIIILRQVCFKLNQRQKNIEIRVPIWEAPIQPTDEYEIKGGKSRKRPDFTCYYFNAHANSLEQQEVPLHVECKRLGSPTSPSWNLNENYVKNGIKRFDRMMFNYGKHAPTGMMIGYIISMTPEEIGVEVNTYQREHLPGYPGIEFDFDGKTIFKARQQINRRYVAPYRFELIHLWADLRAKYQM
jgi:hypothetical protein